MPILSRTCHVTALLWAAGFLYAQMDPGPRGGAPGAGAYYSSLNANEQNFFSQAQLRFQEIDSVSGTMPGETGSGLGPTFNGNSCAMCHAQPAVGGSSPGWKSPQNPVPNPQVVLATLDGAHNAVPPFISASGPVREARFITTSGQSNGPLDGGVHGLYTIQGRRDAPGCVIAQPNFAQELAANNVIFRIPTPTFGLGLVENTPDSALAANLALERRAEERAGNRGRAQHFRQRWHRDALRLEGAEQVADDFRRRSLQRGTRRGQRGFHE